MQALGIWASSGEFLGVPHQVELHHHLGFSRLGFLGKKDSRKRLNFCGTRRRRMVVISGTLSANRHGDCRRCTHRLHLGIGFASMPSRIGVDFLAGEHNRCCNCSLVRSLARVLGVQIDHCNTEEDCGQIHKLFHEGENENVDAAFHELNGMVVDSAMSYDGIGDSSDEGKVVEGIIGDSDHFEEDMMSTKIDVRRLIEGLQFAQSVEDIEEALKDKGQLPLQIYSSMIRVLGREKKLDAAVAIVEWLKKKSKGNDGFDGPNIFVYNSLMGTLKHSEQFDRVEEIMKDMIENGIAPNVVTYNTLMSIYLEQGRPTDALSVFENMQSKGLFPSPSSYSTALLVYRRMEDGFGAIKLFCKVRDKYMKNQLGHENEDWDTELIKLRDFIGRICYQVMRRWLVRDDNMSTDVLKLLMHMDEAGISPTVEEHERLIWACTQEQHCMVVKELYSRLRERKHDVRLSVCNHAIWLMGKAKRWWSALEIYEDLLEKGPKPNTMSHELIMSHFNVLLKAARRRGIWTWGVRLLNKMEEKGLKPGNKEWNAVLLACSKSSETAAAVQVFRTMVDRGLKPTVVSYGALLSALEKGKLYEKAVQVWEHMIKIGIEPNIYTYTIMASINVALGKFHVVDLILQEMISTGNAPTVITFNSIITGCARNGWGGAAYEWFNKMRLHKISADEITYEMLIEALAKDAKPKIAYEMYLRAHKEGLLLSSKAYDAVIQSSQTVGASIDRTLMGPRPAENRKNGANLKFV